MGEIWGMAAAMLSSALGGAAVGATRYIAGVLDPVAVGAFRFGIGVLLLLPLALRSLAPWPARRDWAATVGLGLLFFALFPLLFNAALRYTTAARGALALSTMPVQTMAVAALLGVERLSWRRSLGVLLAMVGVALALLTGLAATPEGAWRGDLLMLAATLCMALFRIASRPVIRRSGSLTFTTAAMGVGVACLLPLALLRGSFAPVAQFGLPQWWALGYLGVFGGAVGFFLWGWALARTGSTLVAVAVTVNPVTAGLVGAWVLDEPLRWNLALGLAVVIAGIFIATTARPRH